MIDKMSKTNILLVLITETWAQKKISQASKIYMTHEKIVGWMAVKFLTKKRSKLELVKLGGIFFFFSRATAMRKKLNVCGNFTVEKKKFRIIYHCHWLNSLPPK